MPSKRSDVRALDGIDSFDGDVVEKIVNLATRANISGVWADGPKVCDFRSFQ